ncbi:MAG: hypothetical protein U0936_02235 [Planctomycetaceae bacterium]
MSEYAYPCPSNYYSGSANCSGICVFVTVVDEEGEFVRWKQCCCGCGPGTFCDEPGAGRDFFSIKDAIVLTQEGEGIHTKCVSSLQDPPDEVAAAPSHAGPQPVYGFIRVQSVDNPRLSFGPTRLNLNVDEKQIEMGGWIVTFTRLQTPGSSAPHNPNAQIHPKQIPMADFDLFDEFRTAMVVLPETSGLNQYIVTVPESSNDSTPPYKHSLLLTRDWQVRFQRLPIPLAVAAADCGCH